jgi:hypothetical protein
MNTEERKMRLAEIEEELARKRVQEKLLVERIEFLKSYGDDDESNFDDFVAQVRQARPDQTFTFEKATKENRMGSHQAHWTFPGARRGGTVTWVHGTNELCWGIDHRDVDAWEQYERSCGREPRYT